MMLLILAQPPVIAADVQVRLIRLEQQIAQLRQIVLAQRQKISQQQRDIQNLQGQVEVLNYQLEFVTNSQEEMVFDLDKHARELDSVTKSQKEIALVLKKYEGQQMPVAQPSTESPKPSKPLDEPPSNSDVSPKPIAQPAVQTDRLTYEQIVELIETDQYDNAIPTLKAFIKENPQSSNADDAQYWLAEIYFVQKKFDLALIAFSALLEEYVGSPKHGEALLKIGYIYSEQGDYVTARAILQQVKEIYADTAVADLAGQHLQEIQDKK